MGKLPDDQLQVHCSVGANTARAPAYPTLRRWGLILETGICSRAERQSNVMIKSENQ